MHEPRRLTPTDIGRIVGACAPSVACLQLRATRLWLIDQQEPFAEIDLHDHGRIVAVRFSVHCSPAWAGIVTAALAREADVLVAPTGFIQDHHGAVLYDHEAEAYWAYHRRTVPLITARFAPQDPPH